MTGNRAQRSARSEAGSRCTSFGTKVLHCTGRNSGKVSHCPSIVYHPFPPIRLPIGSPPGSSLREIQIGTSPLVGPSRLRDHRFGKAAGFVRNPRESPS